MYSIRRFWDETMMSVLYRFLNRLNGTEKRSVNNKTIP